MAYQVLLKKSAEKELEALPAKIHDRIVRALQKLEVNPRPHGVKKLQNKEQYRIRVGDYRILYLIYDANRVIEAVSIAHRREAYR